MHLIKEFDVVRDSASDKTLHLTSCENEFLDKEILRDCFVCFKICFLLKFNCKPSPKRIKTWGQEEIFWITSVLNSSHRKYMTFIPKLNGLHTHRATHKIACMHLFCCKAF